MYRIAVCDDNAEAASELAAQLKELSEERMLATAIDVYASIEELKAALQDGRYDLICMETLVGGSNGLDFVRELREGGSDTDVLFVTSHAQYAIMAYAVFPIGYVLKPGGKKRVRPFFAAAVEKRVGRPSILLRLMDGGEVSVFIDDILYVEVFGTELDVHCRDGVYVCSGSLADTYRMLPSEQFYRSHRSFIVNLRYVTRITRYQFAMGNGDKVTIAKNRYAEAKEILRGFVGKGKGGSA